MFAWLLAIDVWMSLHINMLEKLINDHYINYIIEQSYEFTTSNDVFHNEKMSHFISEEM